MSARRQAAVAVAVLGLVGLVICVALFAGVYIAGETTIGRVVDLSRHGSGSDPTCFPILEYAVAGERHRAQTDIGASPCEHRVGDTVTVYYWPGSPERPTLLAFGALLPVWLALGLCAIAAHLAFRTPKSSERVAEAEEIALASATDGQLVKIRGTIELGPEDEELAAPLTARSCVAWWARVAERAPGEPDRKVQDATGCRGFIVHTASGSARVEPSTAVKLVIDADARGESDYEARVELEAFLREREHPPDVSDPSAHHYVWYEGLFRSGEEVFVVGHARAAREDGAFELHAPEGGCVLVQHVDRENRKRAAHRL